MWYNILLVAVMLLFLVFGFLAGAAVFKAGFQAGMKVSQPSYQSESLLPTLRKQKKPKPPKEIERMNRILENIERYDGTEIG